LISEVDQSRSKTSDPKCVFLSAVSACARGALETSRTPTAARMKYSLVPGLRAGFELAGSRASEVSPNSSA